MPTHMLACIAQIHMHITHRYLPYASSHSVAIYHQQVSEELFPSCPVCLRGACQLSFIVYDLWVSWANQMKKFSERQSLWVSDVTDRKQRWILGGLVVYGGVSSGTWSSFIQIEIKGPASLIHISGRIFFVFIKATELK